MKEDQMWIDIGPEKTALLKDHGFDIELAVMGFAKRGKVARWILAFEHVSDTPVAKLRVELSSPPRG